MARNVTGARPARYEEGMTTMVQRLGAFVALTMVLVACSGGSSGGGVDRDGGSGGRAGTGGGAGLGGGGGSTGTGGSVGSSGGAGGRSRDGTYRCRGVTMLGDSCTEPLVSSAFAWLLTVDADHVTFITPKGFDETQFSCDGQWTNGDFVCTPTWRRAGRACTLPYTCAWSRPET